MEGERDIAGLKCSEVLSSLSDYLDGECDSALRARIDEHLRGCDRCARFGGEMQSMVRALRAHLGVEDPGTTDDERIARITARLRDRD